MTTVEPVEYGGPPFPVVADRERVEAQEAIESALVAGHRVARALRHVGAVDTFSWRRIPR
jgi:hypothetical protein